MEGLREKGRDLSALCDELPLRLTCVYIYYYDGIYQLYKKSKINNMVYNH